ncbi:MAG: ABC transporter ATP-binding protein [Anaerolineae bacterium]|nr:ABC transporter ATP-binding protein [Anaerolineae bacterium]
MSEFAIEVQNLSKQYRLGERWVSYRTIREQISSVMSLSALRQKNRSKNTDIETIWALKDVSFDVRHGEVIGIIGANGAGKSTLLKLLSQITEPTSGRAEISGRIGSLLEVGTGFHQELTGRENIFLNGAILGMRNYEIKHKFDEIVTFAEIEKFLDTPVKHYSSGMYMRLAFAVAAHLDPEILLIDEVLAVGDARFQKKCLGKMKDVAHQGRTVLFVSHNHQAVRRLCERCIWLTNGQVHQIGATNPVMDAYLQTVNSDVIAEDTRPDPPSPDPTNPVRILRLAVCDQTGRPTTLLHAEQPYTVEVEYEFTQPVESVRVAVMFRTAQDVDAFMTTDCDEGLVRGIDRVPGRFMARCHIPAYLLAQGRYRISVWIAVTHVRQLRRREDALIVDVQYTTGYMMQDSRNTAVNPLLSWHTDRVD